MLRAFVLIPVLLLVAADDYHFYRKYDSPTGMNRSCCGPSDCGPVRTSISSAGEIQILVNGKWWPATDKRWYLGESPDGSWHACISEIAKDKEPRCVFGGMGA